MFFSAPSPVGFNCYLASGGKTIDRRSLDVGPASSCRGTFSHGSSGPEYLCFTPAVHERLCSVIRWRYVPSAALGG